MKSKGHLYISLVKSTIRVWGCVWGIIANSLEIALYGLALAELLGVLEELVDKRG